MIGASNTRAQRNGIATGMLIVEGLIVSANLLLTDLSYDPRRMTTVLLDHSQLMKQNRDVKHAKNYNILAQSQIIPLFNLKLMSLKNCRDIHWHHRACMFKRFFS